MRDHIHFLIGYYPLQLLPDLVRDVKASSSKFINEKRWFSGKFQWQTGYGEFSYSHSQIDDVIKYINNQEEHHTKITFKEEYISLLEQNCVNYNKDYLFDFYL
jgi:REP element-mobilizing transposase RayT